MLPRLWIEATEDVAHSFRLQNTSECRSLWSLTVKHRGRQNPITNPAYPALPSLPSTARLKASHMPIFQTCAEAPSSFTGNSRCLSGQIVAPQKMQCRRGHDIECLQTNPRNSFCQSCDATTTMLEEYNLLVLMQIGRCRVNATSKQPKSSSAD